MHADHGVGLRTGLEERVPVARVDAGQAEVDGDLAESRRPHPPSSVAPHLAGRRLHVPQRDQADGDEPPTGVAAPLLNRPIVVGDDAGQPQLLVGALGERLAAKARKGRVAGRCLHPVHVHVEEAFLGVVATGAHVVVGDRRHRHLFPGEPDGCDHPFVGVDDVLVDPGVCLERRLVVELLLVRGCAGELNGAHPPSLDTGASIPELGRKPGLPHVRGLDDVVVDADDLGDRHFVHCAYVPSRSSDPRPADGCAPASAPSAW